MSSVEWPDGLSKSRISKAGSKLRAWARGELTDEEIKEWLEVVYRYRARFQAPLGKVANGLRYMVASEQVDGTVSQRLKRLPTIIQKLTGYESGIDLARMRDIGGCRLVCTTLEELEQARVLITKRWEVLQVVDYVAAPRLSGYRAVHLVIDRDHVPIEVQLRTDRMHAWAETVEAFSGVFEQNFKHDAGNSAVQRYMRMTSKIDQLIEAGEAVPVDLQVETDRLGREVGAGLQRLRRRSGKGATR